MTRPWVPPAKATSPALRFAGGFAAGAVSVLFAVVGLFLLFYVTAAVIVIIMAFPVLLPIPVVAILGPPVGLIIVGRRARDAFVLGAGVGVFAAEVAVAVVVWWIS